MSVFDKAKTHIQNVAFSRNFKFMFYQILNIINRRHIPLIQGKLTTSLANNINSMATEKYLEKYMVPKHNGCFVDVGANIGLWTFFLAKKGIEVHAFEPSPRPYKVLKKNIKKLNIHLYPYALGKKYNTAKLNVHFASGHNSLVLKARDFSGHYIKTIVKPLDDFKFKNVGLIKIDTEGYEIPILFGAKDTIRKEKPRLIIEIHAPYREQSHNIMNILKSLNYKWIIKYKKAKKGAISPQPHIIADPE